MEELQQETTEEALVDEALEQLKDTPESKHSPSDVAAAFFSMNEKKFNNVLKKLSVRQLRRVMMFVASYPLKGEYKPRNDEERSAAYLLNEMVFNRSIMQLEEEMRRVDMAQKAEEQNNENKEVTNG